MNFKTTITLLVLVVLLALIWWLAPSPKEAPTRTPAEPAQTYKPKPLFEPAPETDKLARVEIERPGAAKIVLERVPPEGPEKTPKPPAEWRVVEPLRAPAESSSVQVLASTLAGLRSRGEFEPGAPGAPTPAEAGLEPPVATITLVDESGRKYGVEIGQKAVMSSDTYVRVVGEKTIRLADRDLSSYAKKELSEYRAKRLIELKPEEATRVAIRHEGRSYEFVRGADGEWVINEPIRAYADKDKLRSLLMRISALRAEEFVDDAPETLATYGLDEPTLAIEVTTETKRPLPPETQPAGDTQPATQPAEPKFETVVRTHRLAVGGAADLKTEKRYVRPGEENCVVTVTEVNARGLIPNLKELRDSRVTRIKSASVTGLQITGPQGARATLNKVGNTWQGTDDLQQLDTAAVQDLLQALEDLRAVDYVDELRDPAEYGFDAPRAVLTITTADALTPVVLRIGKDTVSGKNAYVQREDVPGAMVVSAAQAARLAIHPLNLRAREIFAFTAEQVQALDIERGGLRYTLTRQEGSWKLTSPEGAPPDALAIHTLVTDLARLRARNVVGKGDLAAFGLDRPTTTIRFEVEEAPASQPTTDSAPAEPPRRSSHVLRVVSGPKGSFGTRDDDPYVFELDETVFRTLTAELIDTRLFTFKPDQVTGITIVSTGGTLEFVKAGDQWKYAPDPYVELDQKKVQDFVNELTQFRAEAYYTYQNADLAAAGLVDTPARVTIRLADGQEVLLRLTQERPGDLPLKAALVAEQRVFRLRRADCEKLMRGLDEYLKTTSAVPTPP